MKQQKLMAWITDGFSLKINLCRCVGKVSFLPVVLFGLCKQFTVKLHYEMVQNLLFRFEFMCINSNLFLCAWAPKLLLTQAMR